MRLKLLISGAARDDRRDGGRRSVGAAGAGAARRRRSCRRRGRGGFNLPPLLMTTDAFPDGGIVPQKFAGRGGVQPGFKFSGAPEGTMSYAIIFHDIDVSLKGSTGDVLHWIVWNIPASAGGIPEGSVPAGSVVGARHHRAERVLRAGRAGGSPLSPLRLRAVCAERESRSAGDGGTRRAAEGDGRKDRRQVRLRRPLSQRGRAVKRLLLVIGFAAIRGNPVSHRTGAGGTGVSQVRRDRRRAVHLRSERARGSRRRARIAVGRRLVIRRKRRRHADSRQRSHVHASRIPAPRRKSGSTRRPINTCPGAPDAAFKAKFLTHGLYLQEGRNSVHKLYVVVHGGREAVEVFELDARPQTPTLTWIGCAVAPDPIGLNSVRALARRRLHRHELPAAQPADGGASEGRGRTASCGNGTPRAAGRRCRAARRPAPTGSRCPRTAKTLYVAAWGSQSFFRLSRGGAKPERRGSAARIPRRQHPLGARRVDSRRGSGRHRAELHDADREDRSEDAEGDAKWSTTRPVGPFSAGTVAVEIGNDYWVGSFRGDRIAVFKGK